jgi:predicted 2-oxoglutarate/Fe(II)-dependent dioxygenase YbiX
MTYQLIPHFLSEAECDALVQMCESDSDQIQIWQDGVSDHTVKRVWIQNDLNTRMRFSLSEFPVLTQLLQQHNYKIQTNPENTFYVAKYIPGQHLKSHTDPVGQNLSMIVRLNSDYTGGKLHVGGDQAVEWSTGDAVVFDPQVAHAVTKVYSGIRYSLVFWLTDL